jgi:hypothetical protein
MGNFFGFFLGGGRGLDLFDPKVALCYAQKNLGVIKVSAPLEIPQYIFWQ